MLAFVFYRQSEEERAASHRIKRLRNRRYITFREIAEAISESNPAFSKNDVLTQLMTAVWRGHFSTWGGYSRLRYTFFDNNDEPEHARPLCRSPQDWLAEGVDVSDRNFERALFQAVMRGAPADRPGFLGSHVEALTLELERIDAAETGRPTPCCVSTAEHSASSVVPRSRLFCSEPSYLI
jgi:hypothetical protein